MVGRSPNDMYRYEDPCACSSDPNANHSFIALARQLEGMMNYLQHLPEHSQNRCSIYRRIQELRSILQYVFLICPSFIDLYEFILCNCHFLVPQR